MASAGPLCEDGYILTISCPDVRGIVAAVTTFLAQHDCFIRELQQYGDPVTNRFFMRCDFSAGAKSPAKKALESAFIEKVGTPFNMRWELHDCAKKMRVMILVSKAPHCLNDLLHRHSVGKLPMEVTSVASNHTTLKRMAERYDIPFHHLPVSAESKAQQEAQLLDIIAREKVEVVVLARYMQILSANLCQELSGRAINIHHSFLPSFKGARPYHQAFERGVKLIGATAHYVTSDLDEGPIIEQEVSRVDHTFHPQDLSTVGEDTEAKVLAHALKYHLEHRVLLNGHKTIVFK